MNRSTHRPILALLFAVALLLPGVVSAQWVTESYPLKDGWNGIWLSQDCSVLGNGETRTIDAVLAGHPEILEVWRWNPLGSTVQFIQAPSAPIASDTSWAVWRRGDPSNSSNSSALPTPTTSARAKPTSRTMSVRTCCIRCMSISRNSSTIPQVRRASISS